MQLVSAVAAAIGLVCGLLLGKLESRWSTQRIKMYGRDDQSCGRDDQPYGGGDQSYGKDDQSCGRDDQPYGGGDQSALLKDECAGEVIGFEQERPEADIWRNRFPPWLTMVILGLVLGAFFPLVIISYGSDPLTFRDGVQILSYAALACVLCVALATDLDTMTIPNSLVGAALIVWLVTVWFIEARDFGIGALFSEWLGTGFMAVFADGLAAAVLVGGGTLVFSVVYEQLSGKHSLGGGDAKLLCVIALYLGISASISTLFLACLLGLIIAPLWRAVTHSRSKTFPFGPALVLSALVNLILVAYVPSLAL